MSLATLQALTPEENFKILNYVKKKKRFVLKIVSK
jgi:hypothetical protein